MGTPRTKLGLGRKALTKKTTDGTAFIVFRALRSGLVRVYTYATWTDYTTDFHETRSSAREVWKRLVSEGWTVQPDDGVCGWLSDRTACEAA